MACSNSSFSSFPVIAVLLLIAFVYSTVVFLVLDPWLDLRTSSGVVNAAAFTATTLLALFSYALAILRDPGRIPPSYIPDIEESHLQEVKRKGGDLRYCQKCRLYKPPRTHHCRVCKRCVLRMDHHCLWINNCVGHNNYKPFFLFVLYITAACIYSLIILGCHTLEEFEKALEVVQDDTSSVIQPVKASVAASTLIRIICGIVIVPVSVALTGLLVWHIYLSMHNKTTIEYYEGVRAKWLAEHGGQAYKHPYDLGAFSNIVIVFGPRASCWFCPMAVGHIGSGLHFKTLHDSSTTTGKL